MIVDWDRIVHSCKRSVEVNRWSLSWSRPWHYVSAIQPVYTKRQANSQQNWYLSVFSLNSDID